MSKWLTVSLHHVITVYNYRLDDIDGVMRDSAKKQTQWTEDIFFAVKFGWQKQSNYYTAGSPKTPLLHI
jgi:hypothetical protein